MPTQPERQAGPKTWRPAVEPRAVLSVSFSAEQFATVNRAAQAAGERTSAWVRRVALTAAQPRAWSALVTASADQRWTRPARPEVPDADPT